MPTDLRTAAAYVRVSDERQDEYSPASQLSRIREYASAHGYELPEQYVFFDDGISGKTAARRDRFRDLIAVAKDKTHPVDAILVWKFSRFARNQEESIVYKSLLKKAGVEVVSVSEPLPEGPFGSLVERIIEWMDEYYLIRLSGEVRRGMLEKVTRGEPVNGPPPGYDLISGKLTPNADAELVRSVFSAYAAGEGIRTIAVRLGESGVRTRAGNLPDNRFVSYMLQNPTYIGKIRYSTDGRASSRRKWDGPECVTIDGQHPAIIPPELWTAVQARVADVKRRHPYKTRDDDPPAAYMLRGLVRCSTCGATLTRTTRAQPGLQCHNYARGQCPRSHHISMPRAEAAVLDGIRQALASSDFRILPDSASAPASGPAAEEIDRRIASARRRLLRAREAYLSGVDSLSDYKAAKKAAEDEIADAEAQRSAAQTQRPDLETFSGTVRDVLSVLEDPAQLPAAKNAALASIIDRAVYDPDASRLDIFFRSSGV